MRRLRLERVSKFYGEVRGVVDVELHVAPGITGLLGPNGAGKSTLLKLAVGLLKPDAGRVQLDGESVWCNPRVARRLGYLPAEEALPEARTGVGWLRELLRLHGWSRAAAQARALEALEALGLAAEARRPIRTYSQGMRQRLRLAQAWAHDPEVLVLDEPTRGLDPVWRRRVLARVRAFGAAGRVVLWATHLLGELEAAADRVALLRNGRLLMVGPVAELRSHLKRPHRVRLAGPGLRRLVPVLLADPRVVGVPEVREDAATLLVWEPRAVAGWIARLAADEGVALHRLTVEDEDLHAVARYALES